MLSTVLVSIAAVVGVLVLIGVGATAAAMFRGDSGIVRPPKKVTSGVQGAYLETLSAKVAALEIKLEGLPALWEEERERAKKHGDRAQQAVRDLEARLAGGDEERDAGDDFSADDAPGGQIGLMPTVPEAVDDDPDAAVKERAAQALELFGRR